MPPDATPCPAHSERIGRLPTVGPGSAGARLRVLAAALVLAAAMALVALLPLGAAGGAVAGPAGDTTSSQPPPAEQGFAVQHQSPKSGYPSLGPATARTTLVFFTDYQCPVCPRAAREMERLVADFKGELRVEVHHHPLAMHPKAFDAAAAAKAAQRQGKFWEYHETLLNTGRLDRDVLTGLAATLGLDAAAFARDFEDPALRQEIAAEAAQAEAVHADGTPGFLINGHVEVGWASLPWLEQVVRAHSNG